MFPGEFTGPLKRIRKAGGNDAVIAGGAVRDFLLGRPINDIDVFLQSRGNVEDERIVKAAYPGAKEHSEAIEPEYRLQMPELASVWNYTDPNMMFSLCDKIQVIFLNSEASLTGAFKRFDFGLCRVGFDGSQVILTDEFVKDAFNLTMTLINPAHVEHSIARFERLVQKYPHHRLVQP